MAPGCFFKVFSATSAVTVLPLNQTPGLIDDEHAIGIAVERHTEVAFTTHDCGLDVGHIFRLDRAGRVIWKIAVEFEVQWNDFTRQSFEDVGNGLAGHAVSSVDGDFERFDTRNVNERQAVFGESVEDVAVLDRAGGCGSRRKIAGDQPVAYFAEPGVERDRACLGAR